MSFSKMVLAMLATVALLIGIWFGFTQFQRATADYRGETGQIERIEGNPAFRIAAYEQFFDRCAAIQTAQQRIENLEAELESNPSQARKEQINASIAAVKSQRAEQINQYNADAAKEWTRGDFRAEGLPYRISTETENVTCTE